MEESLIKDKENFSILLDTTKELALQYLEEIKTHPANIAPLVKIIKESIPSKGIGTLKAIKAFKKRYYASLTASSGPRSFGYVVGGATPASIVGDWLTSVFDQDNGEGMTSFLEEETIEMLKELFRLDKGFFGSFVSGATMSNFVGLACARQWIAQHQNIDIAENGLYAIPKIKVFSATPHSSIYKALSMLGMGRDSLIKIKTLGTSEAMDIIDLKEQLLSINPNCFSIVVANAGTVNATSFDDLEGISKLKLKHSFWLHIDGAFGLFANCSPSFSHLLNGINKADSITVDAHKWLNVPYDAGVHFTKHPMLQRYVFQNSNAPYLSAYEGITDYMNRTPETSRRLRALSSWFTLTAYGKIGYQEIVERNCRLAKYLGTKIEQSKFLTLLTPVHFNVVCFTLKKGVVTQAIIKSILQELMNEGTTFMTSTIYQNQHGIRAALCNWRTQREDIDSVWEVLEKLVDTYLKKKNIG